MTPYANTSARGIGTKTTPVGAQPVFKPFYSSEDLIEALATEQANSRRTPTLQRMRDHGSERELTTVTPAMIDALAELIRAQPNCADAIECIRRQLALRRLATPPVLSWPPLLLEGPPGVGKTHFAQALARMLDNELVIINCSTVTASFVLSGNNPSWQDSRPGKVVDTLVHGRFANPIILLDEVDKLAGDARFSGYGPLYQLLEQRTAQQFVDEHVGIPVDASHIVWVATANKADLLPEAIRSRFHCVSIAAPNVNQAQAVVQSIYHELLEREIGWCLAFTPHLTRDVANALAEVPPRRMQRVLLSAMGRVALKRSGDEVLALMLNDLDLDTEPRLSRIGFLAS